MGLLKKVAKVGLAGSTGGLSLLGGGKLKDAFFGAKDTGVPDSYLELDPSLRLVTEKAREGQLKGAELYGSRLSDLEKLDPTRTATQRINAEIGQASKVLGQQGEDAKRFAGQEIAKRGLGRSSVGLNALMRADEESRKGLSSLLAGRGRMEEDLRTQLQRERMADIGQATGGLNSLLGAQGAQREFMQGRAATGRGGGLLGGALGLAGSLVGAKYGGKEGAAAGGQFGGGLGRTFANF
jgi:hypothetical protein